MKHAVEDLFSLKDRVAVVTGGAGYLGGAISETLAGLGARVVVCSRDGEHCRTFAENLAKTHGVACLGMAADLKVPKTFTRVLDEVRRTFGRIDIVVNSAWSTKKNTFESTTEEDWRSDMEWLTATFLAIKSVVEDLKKTRGVILNIGTMYGIVAPDYRIYEGENLASPPGLGAGKAGLLQLTRYLAGFLSPYGIRVNSLSPGPFPFPETRRSYPSFMEKLAGKNPMGRIGDPEDIRGAVALLCSDASSYMTGQNVCVDGGWTVW